MSTYEPIASQTLGSTASEVTFSSLPQNYTDLVLIASCAGTSNDLQVAIRYNNDSTSNYSMTELYGNGSSAGSYRISTTAWSLSPDVSIKNTLGQSVYKIDIFNYANATTYKTGLCRLSSIGSTYSGTAASVGMWRKTPEPITQITLIGPFASGSTFSIYGVAAGNSSAKATGGNIVTTDGTYWYHTFTSSGIFVPNSALTCDYLVVAGGGGGGISSTASGGGGGGGGYLTSTGLSLTSLTQVLVGAGGSSNGLNTATNGNDSKLGALTATGGGNGGWIYSAPVGSNGGSGGGGGGYGSGTSTPAGGTGSQGSNGGLGKSSSTSPAGGGGGGGSAAGGNGSISGANGVGGTGGNGYTSSYSGTSTVYVGGGGGGAIGASYASGGTGGGGAGGNGEAIANNATPGTANTGGGGGGGVYGATSAYEKSNGGSGVVIIRYAV